MRRFVSETALPTQNPVEKSTIRTVSWRLVPFLMFAYFLAYLDRVNLGFAALTMNRDLNFTPLIYSWGAGIFFIAYFIFEVPSNIALEKFGAGRWIARIMVTWGVISTLMALLNASTTFYVLRFALGAAEAGFFPGIILYLTYWYPARYRASIVALFAIAVPVSTVIGAPVSAMLLGLEGVANLKGWQWLFIIEGGPSILMGIVAWFFLTDKPDNASWLAPEQKEWLHRRLESERVAKEAVRQLTLIRALISPRVGSLSLVYFGFVAALYGMQFWLPQIVKAFGLSNINTGFVTAIPYLAGAIAMVLWGTHSDRTRERVWHVALPLLLTGISLAACGYFSGPVPTMLALTLTGVGLFCTLALFWTLPTAFLSDAAAAVGIALINSIGNLAGFGGPYLVGWLTELTGSAATGLWVLSVLPLISAVIVILMKHDSKLEFAESARAQPAPRTAFEPVVRKADQPIA